MKKLKLESPYLNAHLHINMNSHIQFHENPLNGLGGVAITNFFLMRISKGRKPALRGQIKKW